MQTTAGPLRGAPTARGHRLFPICIRNNTPRPRKSKSVTSCIRSTFFFFFFFDWISGTDLVEKLERSAHRQILPNFPLSFSSPRAFLCKHHVIVISRQLNFFFCFSHFHEIFDRAETFWKNLRGDKEISVSLSLRRNKYKITRGFEGGWRGRKFDVSSTTIKEKKMYNGDGYVKMCCNKMCRDKSIIRIRLSRVVKRTFLLLD